LDGGASTSSSITIGASSSSSSSDMFSLRFQTENGGLVAS
jgi:hypothetical protein